MHAFHDLSNTQGDRKSLMPLAEKRREPGGLPGNGLYHTLEM